MNGTTSTEATSTMAAASAPKPGPMTKNQRKEHFDSLGALQTQLDVSVSLARSKVASWLNTDGLSDDEDDKVGPQGRSGNFASINEMKARQPGLGLGAKFISHKDQMRHVPLNAFESKLKRQLTGGKVAADLKRYEEADKNAMPDKYREHKLMMAAKRKEQQLLAEEEEDSRTRNVGGKGSITGSVLKEKVIESQSPKDRATTSTGHSVLQQHHHHHHQQHDKEREHSGHHVKPKHHQSKPSVKYQAAVHPAALKTPQSESHAISTSSTRSATESSTSASTLTPAPSHTSATKTATSKKRPGDFFSMYMDERAERMAKKKKKSQAKRDPDDDD